MQDNFPPWPLLLCLVTKFKPEIPKEFSKEFQKRLSAITRLLQTSSLPQTIVCLCQILKSTTYLTKTNLVLTFLPRNSIASLTFQKQPLGHVAGDSRWTGCWLLLRLGNTSFPWSPYSSCQMFIDCKVHPTKGPLLLFSHVPTPL